LSSAQFVILVTVRPLKGFLQFEHLHLSVQGCLFLTQAQRLF